MSVTSPNSNSESQSSLQRMLSAGLDALEESALLRSLSCIEAVKGANIVIAGKQYTCWCSNDYLGLSQHPKVLEVLAETAVKWGVGSRASRLLAGTTQWHQQLEFALAKWFGTESALVFSSGYLTNLGVLKSLLSPKDEVFVDRLSHASLIDAVRSTGARFRVYQHNDSDHLNVLLERSSNKKGHRIVVTEGVFSMDGDRSPLRKLIETIERNDAYLYLDDAHGCFISGRTGRGACEAADITSNRVIYMGTLSKALGAQGGFIVGSTILIRWITNQARTFIYDTALAVSITAAAFEALRMLEAEPIWRVRFNDNYEYLGKKLFEAKIIPENTHSWIVPIPVGKAQDALQASKQLEKNSHWAPAIRPPTVPVNTARLRLSVTALHSKDQIDHLVSVLSQTLSR